MALKRVTQEEMCKLIEWIREFVRKTNMKGIVIALSGGADSALVAALCVKALGNDRVCAINIPIESSASAQSDAELVAKWLNICLLNLPLDNTFHAFERDSQSDDFYKDLSAKKMAILLGNVKARLRTTLARLWAEALYCLFVNTCNWSETIVGYDTKGGGDADGDFGPLQQFVKGEVFQMLEWLGAPQWLLDKVPSADLEPGQSDEADLKMTYKVLDTIASVFATDGMDGVNASDISPNDCKRFIELYMQSLHKRGGMPVFQREGFVYKE